MLPAGEDSSAAHLLKPVRDKPDEHEDPDDVARLDRVRVERAGRGNCRGGESEEHAALDSLDGVVARLEAYSRRIPNAVPSKRLALDELSFRCVCVVFVSASRSV